MEALRSRDEDRVREELLDIFLSLAWCVRRGWGQPDGPWLQELGSMLIQARPLIEAYESHANPDVAEMAAWAREEIGRLASEVDADGGPFR